MLYGKIYLYQQINYVVDENRLEILVLLDKFYTQLYSFKWRHSNIFSLNVKSLMLNIGVDYCVYDA